MTNNPTVLEAVSRKIVDFFRDQFREKGMNHDLITERIAALEKIVTRELSRNHVCNIHLNAKNAECSGIMREFMKDTSTKFSELPEQKIDFSINLNIETLIVLTIDAVKPIHMFTLAEYESYRPARRHVVEA